MFALIESCPDARPGFGWTGKAISLAIHAFVISLAIAVTNTVASNVSRLPVDSGVIWDVPPVRTPTTLMGGPPRVMQPAALEIPNTVPVDIPQLPLPGFVTVADPDPFMKPGASLGPIVGPGPGASIVMGTAPVDERLVEELPVLISHPPIRYPEVLRQAGVQGRVMIETVLDTLGRAEPGLTRIVSSAHALFDREALDVVLGSRYRPARVAGRVVRVRVQVPVNFEIR
ncbi:MAG TPA: TonB family protein [Gemmatimonadales bacterium]|jgi:protein TonB